MPLEFGLFEEIAAPHNKSIYLIDRRPQPGLFRPGRNLYKIFNAALTYLYTEPLT